MAEAETTAPSKACKGCGEVKPLEKFGKLDRARDGREGTCYSCKHKRRVLDPKIERERALRWRRDNRDHYLKLKLAESERRRRRQGRRPQAVVDAEWAVYRAKKVRARQAKAAERQAAILAYRMERPWLEAGLSKGQSFSLRYKLDPTFNLTQRIRAARRRKERPGKIGDLARSALGSVKRPRGSRQFERQVGYSIECLRHHLERQFTKGMTWQAFMSGAIHIDHIVPLSAFDLPQENAVAWALSNLRPMWAEDNLAKSDRRVYLI